jgi:hypothetical protein
MADETTPQDEQRVNPDDQLVGSGERPLPPIPDGGLGAAMPDWLTRPTPATLRRLARQQGARRPEPADFARAEDVPAWLAAIRDRAPGGAAAVDTPAAVPAPTFPRVEPMYVEARPPAPTPVAEPAPVVAAPAPVVPPRPSTPVPPITPAPEPAGGTSAVWLVIGVLLALAIAFGIGMLAGAGFRP